MCYLKQLSILTLTILLIGCGNNQIEGQSSDELYESYSEIKNNLPKNKQKKFRKSVGIILGQDFSSLGDALKLLVDALNKKGGSLKEKGMRALFKKSEHVDKLRGKTPKDIYRMAQIQKIDQNIKIAREGSIGTESIKDIKKEIKELRTKREKTKNSRSALKKFKILKSVLTESDNRFADSPQIRFKLKNNLGKVVREVKLNCKYLNEKRGVTYAEDAVILEFSSNISSGEVTTFVGRPNIMSDLSDVTIYQNANLTCSPTATWGPSSSDAFYRVSFGEEERKKLNKLKNKLQERKNRMDSLRNKKDSLKSFSSR